LPRIVAMTPIDVSSTSQRTHSPTAVLATAFSILSVLVVMAGAGLILFDALTLPPLPQAVATGLSWIEHGSLSLALSLAVLGASLVRQRSLSGPPNWQRFRQAIIRVFPFKYLESVSLIPTGGRRGKR
jgi:hypothetical protein